MSDNSYPIGRQPKPVLRPACPLEWLISLSYPCCRPGGSSLAHSNTAAHNTGSWQFTHLMGGTMADDSNGDTQPGSGHRLATAAFALLFVPLWLGLVLLVLRCGFDLADKTIVEMLQHIIWPFIVFAALVLFRDVLKRLVDRIRTLSLKAGDVEVKSSISASDTNIDDLDEVTAEMDDDASPSALPPGGKQDPLATESGVKVVPAETE